MDINHIKTIITSSLEDDKAEDIIVIDLAGKTELASYMIVATGRVSRHLQSMADHIMDKMLQEGQDVSSEGMTGCDWVLIDAMDIIVHLFTEEARQVYDLESLWKFGKSQPKL